MELQADFFSEAANWHRMPNAHSDTIFERFRLRQNVFIFLQESVTSHTAIHLPA